jgi:hypothetical protein
LALVIGMLPAGSAYAQLRCVPSAADLGEIVGGPAQQRRFELVNDGKVPVEIVEIERGCGCLEPRLDRTMLRPGEKAMLDVVLRTAGQPNGPRSWNLRVRYRDGASPKEILVVLAATIRNEVTVQPSILAVHVQGVLRQEVVVTDRRSKLLRVTKIETATPGIRASIQSSEGGVTKLLLEVSASALPGDRQETVLNIYTDDPLYNPLQLPITASRGSKAEITVTPPQVRVRASASEPLSATLVRLRPPEGQKIAIESVDANDPGVTCTWAAGPGDGATLKVRVDRRQLDARDGPRSVQVRLLGQSGQMLTIPVLVERE